MSTGTASELSGVSNPPTASETVSSRTTVGPGWTSVTRRDRYHKAEVSTIPSDMSLTYQKVPQPGNDMLYEVHGFDAASGCHFKWSGRTDELREAATRDTVLSDIASRDGLNNDRHKVSSGTFKLKNGYQMKWRVTDKVAGGDKRWAYGFTTPEGKEGNKHGLSEADMKKAAFGDEEAGEVYARSLGFSSRVDSQWNQVTSGDDRISWAKVNVPDNNGDTVYELLVAGEGRKSRPEQRTLSQISQAVDSGCDNKALWAKVRDDIQATTARQSSAGTGQVPRSSVVSQAKTSDAPGSGTATASTLRASYQSWLEGRHGLSSCLSGWSGSQAGPAT